MINISKELYGNSRGVEDCTKSCIGTLLFEEQDKIQLRTVKRHSQAIANIKLTQAFVDIATLELENCSAFTYYLTVRN